MPPPPAADPVSALEVAPDPALDPAEPFGLHLMLDVYGADPEALRDAHALDGLLHALVERLGMHLIHPTVVVEVGPKYRKDPGGLSGFAMIAESHVSLHTFPRRRFATLDVYTCQPRLDLEMAQALIAARLGAAEVDAAVQVRGRRYPPHDLV